VEKAAETSPADVRTDLYVGSDQSHLHPWTVPLLLLVLLFRVWVSRALGLFARRFWLVSLRFCCFFRFSTLSTSDRSAAQAY
jgi:hypothetical protein